MTCESNQAKPDLGGIHELLFGASKALALKLAIEIDVFTMIASGNTTLESLSKATKMSVAGASALVNALCGLGFLTKQSTQYHLTQTSETFLVRGIPTYYGDSYLDALLPWAWALDSLAVQAIKTGQGVGKDITTPDSRELWRSWTAAHAVFYERIAVQARSMWEDLSPIYRVPANAQILDVACGHAVWTLVLLQDGIAKSLTLVDQYPEVLDIAWKLAEMMGVRDRIELKERSVFSLDINPSQYDIAYIGGILYLFSLDEIIAILRSVQQTLKVGGVVIANTMISDEERSKAVGPLIQGLRRCLYNGRNVPTFSEYSRAFREAGYEEVCQHKDVFVLGKKLR